MKLFGNNSTLHLKHVPAHQKLSLLSMFYYYFPFFIFFSVYISCCSSRLYVVKDWQKSDVLIASLILLSSLFLFYLFLDIEYFAFLL